MDKTEILKKIEGSGLSIAEIARRCGKTRVTIYSWIDSEEKNLYDKILSVLPSDTDELGMLKQTNRILLEKISLLESENERLRVQSEKDIVLHVSKKMGRDK